ncbi:MAG TPA: hypothetical protein VNT79_04010 [Phycisphaerae bacterium]|nr:hypothetical protein [Phycisphaerae bacterium]
MAPLSAKAALDRYFLETRCKLIEIAANLDRIERGDDAAAIRDDPRMLKIDEALAYLLHVDDHKENSLATHIQLIFSLKYEEGWPAPNAKRHAAG